MKTFGLLLFVFGAVVAIAALFMETSVATQMPGTSLYSLTSTSDVYNLGKLQTQLLTFISGCAIAIIGAVVTSAGAVLERLMQSGGYAGSAAPAGSLPRAEPASQPVYTEEEQAERVERMKRLDRNTYLGLGVVVFFVAMFLVLSGGITSSQRSQSAMDIENNASAIADAIERNAAAIDDMGPPSSRQ